MPLSNDSTTSAPPSTVHSTRLVVSPPIESESVGYLVLNGLAAGIAAYLFAAQLIYCCRSLRPQFGKLNPKIKTEETLLVVAPIVAFTAVGLRIALTLLALNIPSALRIVDHLLRTFIVIFYSSSLIVTYSVLWLRQRVVYLKPTLHHLSNPTTRFFSKYFIIYIVLSGIITFSAVSALNLIETCFDDCFVVVLFVVALVVWPLSCQIPLLILMLFPLYKHQTSNQVTHNRYVKLMIRIATLTAVCLVSDITTVVTSVYVDVYFTPQQFNLIVNLVCVTLTPINWKEKILPCCVSSSKESK